MVPEVLPRKRGYGVFNVLRILAVFLFFPAGQQCANYSEFLVVDDFLFQLPLELSFSRSEQRAHKHSCLGGRRTSSGSVQRIGL